MGDFFNQEYLPFIIAFPFHPVPGAKTWRISFNSNKRRKTEERLICWGASRSANPAFDNSLLFTSCRNGVDFVLEFRDLAQRCGSDLQAECDAILKFREQELHVE